LVTYAYHPGSRYRTYEQIFDLDAEVGRAHYAEWSDRPVVVQKEVTQFPASFEIPVATPKDKQPVYPRMVLLRREVLAPGQKPLPVPVKPTEPNVPLGATLATLPNPWTIGTDKPPKMDDRPTQVTSYAPANLNYVSKSGEVFEHQFIKWLKDSSEAWILQADFEDLELPDPKRLASAKLAVHVVEAHDQAPMQVAAVSLKTPFTPGSAYDFTKLGDTVGWTIIARGHGPGAPFNPPRAYEIDVTKAVRAWARGESSLHAFALRIVPNRGVDDGWTVRFTPAKEKPLELKIETYAD
jgi:hypothetical protein